MLLSTSWRIVRQEKRYFVHHAHLPITYRQQNLDVGLYMNHSKRERNREESQGIGYGRDVDRRNKGGRDHVASKITFPYATMESDECCPKHNLTEWVPKNLTLMNGPQ